MKYETYTYGAKLVKEHVLQLKFLYVNPWTKKP